MRRLIAWWMSAPFDERSAVLLIVCIWALGAACWVIDPASSHP
ncbi:hypothetical protein FHS47_000878 [Lutibacter sp. SG786]|nr:hypothetical protein [Luteibacter sp. SG786]